MVDLFKVIFCISKIFIQCNIGSCCVHIIGGVNIYLFMCVSLLVHVCPVFVYLCVWFQIRALTKAIPSMTNLQWIWSPVASNTQNGTAGITVPWFDNVRSIIPLSKITSYMWRDHLFKKGVLGGDKTGKRGAKQCRQGDPLFTHPSTFQFRKILPTIINNYSV